MYASSVGLVPPLWSNNDESGYIIKASGELNDDRVAHKAFRPGISKWRANGEGLTPCWIEIQCLVPVRIHMITIKPVDGVNIVKWKVQGKNQMTDWTDLKFSTGQLTSFEIVYNNHTIPASYQFYKIIIQEAAAANPGLSHLQLFPLSVPELTYTSEII